jgi:hypothetical protein
MGNRQFGGDFEGTCPCCTVQREPLEAVLKKPFNGIRYTFEDATMTPNEFEKYKKDMISSEMENSFINDEILLDRKLKLTIRPYSPPIPDHSTQQWKSVEIEPFQVSLPSIDTMSGVWKQIETKLRIPRNYFVLWKDGIEIHSGKMAASYNLHDEIQRMHPELTREINGSSYRGPIPTVSTEDLEKNKNNWPVIDMILFQKYDLDQYLHSLPVTPNQVRIKERLMQIEERAKKLEDTTIVDWRSLCFETWPFYSKITKPIDFEQQLLWKSYYQWRNNIEKLTAKTIATEYRDATTPDFPSAQDELQEHVRKILSKAGAMKKLATEQQKHICDLVANNVYLYKVDYRGIMGDIIGANYFVRFYSPFNVGYSIDLMLDHFHQIHWSSVDDFRHITFVLRSLRKNQGLVDKRLEHIDDKNTLFLDDYDSDREKETYNIIDISTLREIRKALFESVLQLSDKRFMMLLMVIAGMNNIKHKINESSLIDQDFKYIRRKLESSNDSDTESKGKKASDKIECSNCGKKDENGVTLKKCAGCHSVFYCNAECQKKDWSNHRVACKRLSQK